MKKLILLSITALTMSCTENKSKSTAINEDHDTVQVSNKKKYVPNETQNNTEAEKIKLFLTTQYLNEGDLRAIDPQDRKFSYQQIDLNNDGKKETFVDFSTPYFCGTGGCTIVLLDDKMKLLTKFTVTNPPFYIETNIENGWSALYLKDGSNWKRLDYKNGKYPSNPSALKNLKTNPDTAGMTTILDPAKSEKITF